MTWQQVAGTVAVALMIGTRMVGGGLVELRARRRQRQELRRQIARRDR